MSYDAKSIQTLSFLEAIRTRIAMYLGSADNQGVLQCVREIITNSIDEYTMGYGKKITVKLYPSNRISILDEARGAPFGLRADGTDALEAIYMLPHSGGKFNEKIYQNVGGQNGIGAKGVALSSKYFKVISYRDGLRAELIIEDGIKKSLTTVPADKNDPVSGTYVEFVPAPEVYHLEPIHINFSEVQKMCRDWSYLCPGLEFNLTDENGKEYIYCSQNGLLDFMKDEAGKSINKTPLSINFKEGDISAEIVMEWTTNRSEQWYVFTNGLENSEGGTSLTGIKTALTNFFKKKLKNEAPPDLLRKGLFYAVSCKIPNPSFANQTKTKINNIELRGLCQRATTQMLEEFETKHRDEFDKIVDMLTKEQKAEIAAEKARAQVLTATKDINDTKKRRIILADKLKDCQIHGSESGSILTICEGETL